MRKIVVVLSVLIPINLFLWSHALETMDAERAMAQKYGIWKVNVPVKGGYELWYLGAFGGKDTVYHESSINNLGHIVGAMTFSVEQGRQPFVWKGEPTITTAVPVRLFENGAARSINDHDQIAGFAFRNDHVGEQAILWDRKKSHWLGNLPGYSSSVATGINNSGHVVGRSFTNDEKKPYWAWRCRAFLWKNGKMQDLGVPPGGKESRAYAINDREQVVGWALNAQNQTRAVLYEQGQMHELPLLSGGKVSQATAINNTGQIVGSCEVLPGVVHPVLWENGKAIDLGILPGATYGKATGVNNSGQVVGWTRKGGDDFRSFLWDRQNGIRDINSLLPPDFAWSIEQIWDNNDRGELLAYGKFKVQQWGHVHTFFLFKPEQ